MVSGARLAIGRSVVWMKRGAWVVLAALVGTGAAACFNDTWDCDRNPLLECGRFAPHAWTAAGGQGGTGPSPIPGSGGQGGQSTSSSPGGGQASGGNGGAGGAGGGK